MHTTTYANVTGLIARLTKARKVYEVYHGSFDHLGADVEITERGIEVTPTDDPFVTLGSLDACFADVIFTRQQNPDLTYSWVSEIDGVPVIILANEVIDHTGTTIQAP